MAHLALLDLVTPYVFGGGALGEPIHELLSALFVDSYESAYNLQGVTLTGTARFSASLKLNPPRFTPPASLDFGGSAAVDHTITRRPGAWWDFPDIAIRFRLSVPRQSSPVADGVIAGTLGGPLGNAGVAGVLNALGTGTGDGAGTAFTLELLCDLLTLHLPFLRPAKLRPDGMLEEDTSLGDVKVSFPKLKFSITQTAGSVTGGSVTDPAVSLNLDSWAASTLDDPSGTLSAELIRMEPPYALIGPGNTLGFGFQSLILDLSGTSTPPELLAKFGVGDDFRGLYLPDVRVFVAPEGLSGLGVDVSARELLIGVGPEGGLSGIFGLDIVNPARPQSAVVNVYTLAGTLIRRLELPEAPAPPAPVPPYAADIEVPDSSIWTVEVTGGQPPYNIRLDGQDAAGMAVTLTIPDGQAVALSITDVHGGPGRSATFQLNRHAPALGLPIPTQGNKDAALTPVTSDAGFRVTMQDLPATEQVVLRFDPPGPTQVQITRGAATTTLPVSGVTATVALVHGQSFDVQARWDQAAAPAQAHTLHAYFRFDEPHPIDTPDQDGTVTAGWAAVPDHLHHTPSKDAGLPLNDWLVPGDTLTGSSEFAGWISDLRAAVQGQGQPVTPLLSLEATASVEARPNPDYNVALSWRRLWALRALLKAQVPELLDGHFGPANALGETGDTGFQRGANRRAVARFDRPAVPASSKGAGAHVARPVRDPVPVPRPPTVRPVTAVGPPSVQFREFHLRVQIDHNRLIAIELRLKLDVQTALESYLSHVQQTGGGPPGLTPQLPVGGPTADTNDGLLDLRVQLTLDDTLGRWQVLASLFEQDRDGFLQTPKPTTLRPVPDSKARDFLGVLIALAPLLDATASANTAPGLVTALVLGTAVPTAAVASGLVKVPRITLYGGELTVTRDNAGVRSALLLDVEVALVIVLAIGGSKLIDTDPDNPITVRYRAVGFATSDQPRLRDAFPVFDSSKGYTINIPSGGGVHVPAPLGDILQVEGTRIARSNPVNLELDLTLKADLGVVSVDRTTVRIPLDGGAPTITALGVTLSIPGAIEGHGYLAIFPDGFAGQLDISLPGLGVRIAAGLSVRHVVDPADAAHSATAVMVTLEVDFSVPIALGSSGLGLYGFGGLFALHHRRNENAAAPVPALDWLMNRVENGNPLDIRGWVPDIDHWAIGLGAVLGTLDAGFTLNVKGILIFEMPGPRILLVMKANLLWPKPPRGGRPEATILAVIDVDLGRHRITIGLTFDYAIKPLIRIHVPVRAIFPFDDIENFALDAGTWYDPATVEFFELFKARGYFMVRGKGIPNSDYDAGHLSDFPLGQLNGFAIATGVSVSFVWGSESSGLYLKVGASADIGIGFSPLLFRGELKVWGELHLWIVGIEASAKLSLTAGEVPAAGGGTRSVVLIDGEAHAKIDFFFFSIEGSVHVSLGEDPGAGPSSPPPLVTGVSLQSRTAALVQGSGVDRPIDGKLFDAHPDGPAPLAEAVPIDSVIVVHFDCVPRVKSLETDEVDSQFVTQAGGVAVGVPIGPLPGSVSPAVRRGADFFTYRLTTVRLDQTLTSGEVPIVWWAGQASGTQLGPDSKVALALLSRVPSAHPSAVEHSRHLIDDLDRQWADLCRQVAPPTSVLWTFRAAAPGASASGWALGGVAWPDPPGSARSVPTPLGLQVAETWRRGGGTDARQPVWPARVLGSVVPTPMQCAQRTPAGGPRWPAGASRADELSSLIDLSQQAQDVAALITQDRLNSAPGSGEKPGDPLVVRPDVRWADLLGLRGSDFRALARVLEAPFRRAWKDQGRQHPLYESFRQALEPLSHAGAPPRLDDVVAFSPGVVVQLRALLLVSDVLLSSGLLTLRAFSAGGQWLGDWMLDGTAPDVSRVITRADDLPKQWLDPAGPWLCEVQPVLFLLAAALGGKRGTSRRLLLLDTKLPDGVAYLHLGIQSLDKLLDRGLGRPSFVVGVVEALHAAEVQRAHTEQEITNYQIQTVEGALTGLPNPPALLKHATEYNVSVDYEWARCDAAGTVQGDWTAGPAQNFHFRTDDAPLKARILSSQTGEGQPSRDIPLPVRLDPWVLTTDPDEGEHFFFWQEPLNVVLAVDYLLEMYAEYGVPLQARVRAASYRNADPGSLTFPLTVQALTPALAAPLLNVAVFTPWEGVMREHVLPKVQGCVDVSGSFSRHRHLSLNLLLEPMTDYVFDLEVVGAPAPVGQDTPLFRRRFTTSRYAGVSELCADVGAAAVRQQPASDTELAGLLALAPDLSQAALDTALRAAGLSPALEVDQPGAEVLWRDVGGVWQPRVIMLRTPEPLFRTRRVPVDVEPPGQPRLGRKVARLERQPFLEVVARTGGPASISFRAAPDLGITVIVLDGARGTTLNLALRRHNNSFLDPDDTATDTDLLRLSFAQAPWEVLL